MANQCFTYDGLQRLTEAWTTTAATCQTTPTQPIVGGTAPYWTSYSYANVCNRTQQIKHNAGGDITTTYTSPTAGSPRPHGLSSSTTTGVTGSDIYSYDNTGNTTTRNVAGTTQTLTWDPEGHLATHTINGQTTSYLYTPDGARLLRKDPAGSATAYTGGFELQKASGGALSATRFYGDIATRTSTALTWTTSDHHATAQVSINPTTLAATTRRMMPFGETRTTAASWPNEHGYVGGVSDPTGLTHLGAREYDPTTGRFLSVDPLQDLNDPQQWNAYAYAYAYANNNPTTGSDPTGQFRDQPGGEDPSDVPPYSGPGPSSGVGPLPGPTSGTNTAGSSGTPGTPQPTPFGDGGPDLQKFMLLYCQVYPDVCAESLHEELRLHASVWSMVPGLGVPFAAWLTHDDFKQGNYVSGGIGVLGLIPFSSTARYWRIASSVRVIRSATETFARYVRGGEGVLATVDHDGLLNLLIVKGNHTPAGNVMFTEALDWAGGADAITGVRGTWVNAEGLKDNLNAFNAAVRSGMSPEQAALTATFTGKMASRYGFSNVHVESLTGPAGEYTNVKVVFYR